MTDPPKLLAPEDFLPTAGEMPGVLPLAEPSSSPLDVVRTGGGGGGR